MKDKSKPHRKHHQKVHHSTQRHVRSKKIETVDEVAMKIIAAKKGIPVQVVRDVIITGQSGYTASIMRNGTFAGVRWPLFGVFKVNPKSVSLMRYYRGIEPNFKKMFMRRVKTVGIWPGMKDNKKKNK